MTALRVALAPPNEFQAVGSHHSENLCSRRIDLLPLFPLETGPRARILLFLGSGRDLA